MMYIITEDSNSARAFWANAASIYRKPGTYKVVPLVTKTGGNTTLKGQIDNLFTYIQSGDELFLVIDNIGVANNFNSYNFISKTSARCNKHNVRFVYTNYFCFEEVYLSYEELRKMSSTKYSGVLDYVISSLNNGLEYFDKSNLDKRVIDFLNNIKHSITNKEHFVDDLLTFTAQTIQGDFKIHKSGKRIGLQVKQCFDYDEKCWIHSCKEIQQNMNIYRKENICNGKCSFKCKGYNMLEKLKDLNSNSILRNW